MRTQDFIESLYDYTDELTHLFDEMFWEGGFNGRLAENVILSEAKERDVKLEDWETFGTEDFLYSLYRNTEKGLS